MTVVGMFEPALSLLLTFEADVQFQHVVKVPCKHFQHTVPCTHDCVVLGFAAQACATN
jgi:hypothetical protein